MRHCVIWHHLCSFKKVKNTYGGVLLLVKLQALYQIVQSITYDLFYSMLYSNLNEWQSLGLLFVITGPILEIWKRAFSSKKGQRFCFKSISRHLGKSIYSIILGTILHNNIPNKNFGNSRKEKRTQNILKIGPASIINGLHRQGHV